VKYWSRSIPATAVRSPSKRKASGNGQCESK
jgi:hypothetical protein